jgi:hypothetical protein
MRRWSSYVGSRYLVDALIAATRVARSGSDDYITQGHESAPGQTGRALGRFRKSKRYVLSLVSLTLTHDCRHRHNANDIRSEVLRVSSAQTRPLILIEQVLKNLWDCYFAILYRGVQFFLMMRDFTR